MQAIILADVQVNNINEPKNNNLKCMIEINGVRNIFKGGRGEEIY